MEYHSAPSDYRLADFNSLWFVGGGPNNSTMSLSLYAYKIGFDTFDMGYAMTISNASMILSFLVFGIIFIRYNAKAHKEGQQ